MREAPSGAAPLGPRLPVKMPTNTADIRRYLTQTGQHGLSQVDGNGVSPRGAAVRQPVTEAPTPIMVGNHVSRKRPGEALPVYAAKRRRIIEDAIAQENQERAWYLECVAEISMLEMSNQLLYDVDEAPACRSRLRSPQVQTYLQRNRLVDSDEDEDLNVPLTLPILQTEVTPGTVGAAGRPPSTEQLLSPYKTTAATPRPPQTLLYDAAIGNQQLIAERVKQEAYVAQRISELQREGLWAEKRLPKVQEPPRTKAHWDYLLEEMTWLSADFAQERKWKKANAKKCAKMVQKYFMDKESLQRKEEKSQELKLRRIANIMAKEIKNFWSNVNKLVEYKQTTRLEEKRKKALDQHLSFIVDQTERYSSLLAESMNKPGQASASAPSAPTGAGSDDEFKPDVSSSDDEATIAKDEDERDADEVERLKNESEMPLDDLLDLLPKDYFLNRDKDLDSLSTKSEDVNVEDAVEEGDKDKTKENKRKSARADSDDDESATESEESDVSQSDQESTGSPDDDISLKTLVENKNKGDADQERADKEIKDVTALAESIQPKGSTLQTTEVVTKVPFLIKHPLREYQHIGLDWLVTMFDRKLNGILADEMGLGKTIQTIALLTHLACDKGNWGPHLIVVPTSVMLNWEMEFKKWCPAFKILTYYGTIRERKAKRTGWTKDNAFHICITSYKLVIQDHGSFRRKKWQYLVLDEAQNIKNFRSQRWQLLLNFQTARRLLLTGTPLQNNLMELWSLMHFLMPNVFQSHREFKEWFSNPVTGMLEGNSEYNENIIKRLHKVLRPFLLRRLKTEVEKQLPKKYEHVVMCRLSKRQRYLYDDFMSRAKTKETLESGNLLSVINVLMQLRKVCNHPNLFEVRPIISPFQMEGIVYRTASLATTPLDYDPERHVSLDFLNLRLADAEKMSALEAFMTWRQRARRQCIEELDALVTAEPPRPPKQPLRLMNIANTRKVGPTPVSLAPLSKNAARLAALPPVQVGRSPSMRLQNHSETPVKVAGSEVHLIPGKQARLPVHLVQTATGRHIYFPLQSGPAATANSVIANGQRMTIGTLKPPPTNTVPQAVEVDADANLKTMSVQIRRLPSPTLVQRVSDPDIISPPLRSPPKDVVEERRRARRAARLSSLAAVQERRCERYPIYGSDVVSFYRVVDQPVSPGPADWRWSGSAACYALASARLRPQHRLWHTTEALAEAVKSPQQLVDSLQDMLSRFIVYVPAVQSQPLSMHVSHPPPSTLWRQRRALSQLQRRVAPRARLLHPIMRNMSTQFPDPRLIQYDCGKLQVLDRLLRQLKSEHHKVLLFTQMTRMLDVLEAFLNYHGYIYLRLDGTTKVDQRQVLMERFNTDERIFVFILSTRSGGIGVNLTGADTVVFYDSDWNPTMDAQAQDRCHRIGQTRDVHIYRLVSEMTVEENILKKANQKRLLGDLAIEGGNFTTAYFKSQSTIQDLFNVDMTETDANKRMRQTLGASTDATKKPTEETENTGGDKSALGALESALATAEDAPDVEAAQTASAEAAAELAEFDENIPIEEAPEAEPELSRAEQEIHSLVEQLRPIERYAMRFVEENEEAWSAEQLAAAEAQIEEQKKEWEMNRQAAMEAEEARLRDEVQSEEEDLTYARHGSNEEWLNERSIGGLTMWYPPTPPQELNDVYIDSNLNMLYEELPMLDSELPPIFVKKDLKRSRTSDLPNNLDIRRPMKMSRREDSPVAAPRSLFDHPGLNMQKMRRDVKTQKYRGLARPLLMPMPSPMPVRIPAVRDENTPEWTVHEDYALLQAYEQLQELPLTSQIVKAGHLPNWDLVADMVNMISCCTRSPSQCRIRFETVIIPREEGKITQEQRRQKKNKALYKIPMQKTARALRTSQLNMQDNNASYTDIYHHRMENIKSHVTSRQPNPKPNFSNPTMKNPKHFAVLAESGISYETPLNPVEIATRRADRIAKDKKMQAQLAQQQASQAAVQAGTVQLAQVHTGEGRQLVVTAGNKVAQVAQVVQAVQVSAAPTVTAGTSPSVNVAVSLASGLVGTGQVIGTVNTSIATAAVAQAQATTTPSTPAPTQSIVVASVANASTVLTSQIQAGSITTMPSALRQARPVTAIPVGLQEMVVAAASQARSVTGTNTTATMVSVASLQNARFASGSLVTIPTSVVKGAGTVQMGTATKTLPTQMSFYRQQPLMRPQQRIGVRDQAHLKMVQAQAAKVTHVAQVQPVSPIPQKAASQLLKGPTATSTKGRTEEVAAMVKQTLQRQKTQAAQQQQQVSAQFITQVQAGGPTQVATLVKTSAVQNVSLPLPNIAVSQVKQTIASQIKTSIAGGQMRLANYQQLVNKQGRQGKVAQLTKQGMPTQLIVQSPGVKAVPTISMQHFHQVIKNSQAHITVAAGQGMTGGGQVVLAKAGTGAAATLGPRVVPAVAGTTRQIQVVPGAIRSVGAQSALAGSLKVAGTSQQAFISQVTGLPSIVRQGGNPVRIQTTASGTPIMAVTVQQQQHNQQTDQGQS